MDQPASSIEQELAQVEGFEMNYELESGQSINVKGNLKKNVEFWKFIGAPHFILTTIENGYKLPFACIPVVAKLRNNKSARLHADFVEESISELLHTTTVCY